MSKEIDDLKSKLARIGKKKEAPMAEPEPVAEPAQVAVPLPPMELPPIAPPVAQPEPIAQPPQQYVPQQPVAQYAPPQPVYQNPQPNIPQPPLPPVPQPEEVNEEAVENEIALLQNDGIYRRVLLLELKKIGESLENIEKIWGSR